MKRNHPHRPSSFQLAVALTSAIAVPPAMAGDPPALLKPAPPGEASGLEIQAASDVRPVEVDVARLREILGRGPGARMTLPLDPGGTPVEATVIEVSGAYRGGLVARVSLDAERFGTATVSVAGDAVHARIVRDGRLLALRPAPAGGHALVELDPGAFPPCGNAVSADSVGDEPGEPALAASGSSELFVLDLMVPYTKDVADAHGDDGAIALINLAVALTNQALAQSDALLRVDLVHAFELSEDVLQGGWQEGLEGGSTTTLVGFLASQADVYLDQVHVQRDVHGADAVVLLYQNDLDFSGEAYDILCLENLAGFDAHAFAVVDDDAAAANLSFAHELGHLLGAHHDMFNDPPGGSCNLTGAAFGHITPSGAYRTVMAYDSLSSGATRLACYSTPLKEAPDGHPLGMAGVTENARAIDFATYAGAALWRSKKSPAHGVATTFDGGQTARGVMFDLEPQGFTHSTLDMGHDLELTGFSVNTSAAAGEDVAAEVWIHAGESYAAHADSVMGWWFLGTASGTSAGPGLPTFLALDSHTTLSFFETYGVYLDLVTHAPGSQELLVTPGAATTYQSGALRVTTGVAKQGLPFTGATLDSRVFNGIVHYRGASGERQLDGDLGGEVERDGFWFELEIKDTIRLHGFDVVLKNAGQAAVDVFYHQGEHDAGDWVYEPWSWNHLGTDPHVEGKGPGEAARIAAGARTFAAGVYTFYVNLAAKNLFGQKLLGHAGPIGGSNAHLELGPGAGLVGASFDPSKGPGGAIHFDEFPNLRVRYSVPGTDLAVLNMAEGALATFRVSDAPPGDLALIAFSLAGGGPTSTTYGTIYLSWPLAIVPAFAIGADGVGELSVGVPVGAAGARVWFHGLMAGTLELTNDLCVQVE